MTTVWSFPISLAHKEFIVLLHQFPINLSLLVIHAMTFHVTFISDPLIVDDEVVCNHELVLRVAR